MRRGSRQVGWGWRILLIVVIAWGLSACAPTERRVQAAELANRRIRVTATTTIVADLVRQIGGDRVEVISLMGPGVDPHLYKARESDVWKLMRADLIVYHGLHLEARMADVLAGMNRWALVVAVGEAIPPEQLRYPPGERIPDPHIWFDVRLWKRAAEPVAQALSRLDPTHAPQYRARLLAYQQELDLLDAWIRTEVQRIPPEQRVLVTSHDAFGYFGQAYGFEVRGLLGISTAAEAGLADVQALADFLARRRIRAIFVETSVPLRYLEAVQEAARARGWSVQVSGPLFSDALGDPGSPEGTYIGMIRHNVQTILQALQGE
ncbi:metal ABC transporter solute-binding protein, Zn/Mn family [Thermoflexus sp.]|uniref:metal ABC transporter solute-binding protein, Zn/Mn family n=1 Tax=Thermoflexus sp. TaxID=1969742 RepID=UPI002ADD3C45|nr:zinc ABC transporter substrate-binding protein [Thermoflexus sp.]